MMFDWGTEISFGSNYREVRETEGSRNRDSTVISNNNVATRICTLQVFISNAVLTTSAPTSMFHVKEKVFQLFFTLSKN